MGSLLGFHDYMIFFLIWILIFTSYVFYIVSTNYWLDLVTMDSHGLEFVWTVIPMVILIFIAFPSLYLLYLAEEISFPTLRVQVVGHQWYWDYQYLVYSKRVEFNSYMGGSSSVSYHNLDVDNRLVLPVGSRILFIVGSRDVLHSWTVPSFGIKVDAVPGRLNYLNTLILNTGVFFWAV